MATFWCRNLKVGDVVVIRIYGDKYKYTGEVISNLKHPVIRCHTNETLTGAYTFRRGFKWGSINIYIEQAL